MDCSFILAKCWPDPAYCSLRWMWVGDTFCLLRQCTTLATYQICSSGMLNNTSSTCFPTDALTNHLNPLQSCQVAATAVVFGLPKDLFQIVSFTQQNSLRLLCKPFEQYRKKWKRISTCRCLITIWMKSGGLHRTSKITLLNGKSHILVPFR